MADHEGENTDEEYEVAQGEENQSEDEDEDEEEEKEHKSNNNLMSKDELRFLKDNRKYLRIKTTKACKKAQQNYFIYDIEQCEDDLEVLYLHSQNLKSLNKDISKGLWIHVKKRYLLDKELDSCEKYDTEIRQTIRCIERKREELQSVERIEEFRPNRSNASNNQLKQAATTPPPQLKFIVFKLKLKSFCNCFHSFLISIGILWYIVP